MGEAKRRKLAGTYPVQDGGGWHFEQIVSDDGAQHQQRLGGA